MRKNNKKRLLLFLALVLFLGPTNLLANDDYTEDQKLEEIIVEEIEIDQEDKEIIEEDDLLENTDEEILEVNDEGIEGVDEGIEVVDEEIDVIDEIEDESSIEEAEVDSPQLLMQGVVEVSNGAEFKKAFETPAVTKIVLTDNIVYTEAKLADRIDPLIISGKNNNGNYNLDLSDKIITLGKAINDYQSFRMEDINVANSHSNAFIDGKNNNKWTIEFSNIKSFVSESSKNDQGSLRRLASAYSSNFIFENNIDIVTRLEFVEVGSVLIKDNTNFKGHQEDKSGSLAFSASILEIKIFR